MRGVDFAEMLRELLEAKINKCRQTLHTAATAVALTNKLVLMHWLSMLEQWHFCDKCNNIRLEQLILPWLYYTHRTLLENPH